MESPTLADELAFDALPPEIQRLAIRVLEHRIPYRPRMITMEEFDKRDRDLSWMLLSTNLSLTLSRSLRAPNRQ